MWGTRVLDCLQPERIPTQLHLPGNTLLNILKRVSLYSGSILGLCSHGSYFVSITSFFCLTQCEVQESFEYSVLYHVSLFSLSHGSSILPRHSKEWWLEQSSTKCGVCPVRHRWLRKPAFPPYV